MHLVADDEIIAAEDLRMVMSTEGRGCSPHPSISSEAGFMPASDLHRHPAEVRR